MKQKPSNKKEMPASSGLTPAPVTVSSETLAIIAATLSGPDVPAYLSVIKAYRIWDLVAASQAHLRGEPDCHLEMMGSKIEKWMNHMRESDDYKEYPWEKYLPYDNRGQPLPIPFDNALRAIDPKADKADNRSARFRHWLMHAHKLTIGEAGDKIAVLRAAGFDHGTFVHAFSSFPKWMKRKISQDNSKKGKTSAAVKAVNKGKQGQVKRKGDKRRGARPPVEEFKKAIELT